MNEERNILDSEGNVIITISLPFGTSEEQWQTALSGYIITPPREETEEE